MTNPNMEIVRQEVVNQALPTPLIDSKTIKDFLFTSETKLSEKQQNMFVQLAIRHQLDPFKREIYAISYGNEFNIVTGYQTYIQRADLTGKLDGWECESLRGDNGKLIGARITIYRKDFTHPFVWEVALSEFDKGQSTWKKMPEFMIKKIAIGQGFRLCFPNELGGMPYLQEELEGLQPEKKADLKEVKHETKQEAPKQPTLADRKAQALKTLQDMGWDNDAIKNEVLVATGVSKIVTEEQMSLLEDKIKTLKPPEERKPGSDDI